MATEEKNKTVRKMKRILQFFSVRNTAQTLKKATQLQTKVPILVKHFSEDELAKMTSIDSRKTARTQVTPLDYLQTISEKTKDFTRENKKLYLLNPELKQAKQIFISSIISPNDMQTGTVAVTSNTPGLSEQVQKDVNDFLNEFFNDDLEFGVSLEEWLGNALFEEGATPILVLPYQNVTTLAKYDDVVSGMEAAGIKPFKVDYNADITATVIREATMELNNIEFTSAKKDTRLKDEDVKYMATEAIKFAKAQSSIVSYSYDVTKIAQGMNKAKTQSNKMAEKFDQYFLKNEQDANITMTVTDDIDGDSAGKSTHPTIIKLPSPAVIPIAVPGAKSTHIGYFVLVNEWGNPIDDEMMCRIEQSAKSKQTMEQNTFTNLVNTSFMKSMTGEDKLQAASVAFGITIKNMLEHTFNDLGLDGVTIDKYQALSNCLFYHLLTKNKINVIFVPEQLMVYYAFDYRSNGTGKSMIEELHYILALRTTLIIANIMGTIKNAIDKETISIELDDQDTNIEQTLDIIKNTYIKKNSPKFYNDPEMISRDIVANSLSIIPKNVPGLDHSLEVTTERRGSEHQSVDDTLMEKLSNMMSLGLNLPPSALNLLSEDEYSRSVATNNLFFANNIRSIQRKAAKHNKKFARNVVKYSTYVQEKLNNILTEGKTDDKKDWLKVVLGNLEIKLANPNIVATKAQYEELKEFMSMVDDLIEKVFPDEMYPDSGDTETKEMMGTLRAFTKSKLLRDYIDAVGMQNLIQLPTIKEIDIERITDMHQFLKNLKKGVDNLKKALGGKEEDSGY